MKLSWMPEKADHILSAKTWKRCAKYAVAALALAVWGSGQVACSSSPEANGMAEQQFEQSEGQQLAQNSSGNKAYKKKRYKNKKNKNKSYSQTSSHSGDGQGLVELGRLAPPQKGTLRLASWNVHDLFDTADDPNHDVVLSRRDYSAKLAVLSKVLNRIQADVVGVQEVENQACLKDLAAMSNYPYYLLVEGNDTMRGIDVGVLSKIPIKNYVTHARDKCQAGGGGRSYYFSRDCLEVHFNHPSRLVMLVNHFKSKRGDSDDSTVSQRMAQASRVRGIAAGLQKYPLIIVGDLNDEPNSQALAPLTRTSGLHDVLSWMGPNRVSFKTKRFSSALDYLILNDTLKAKMLDKSARIVVGDTVAEASDHRPVIVDVRL